MADRFPCQRRGTAQADWVNAGRATYAHIDLVGAAAQSITARYRQHFERRRDERVWLQLCQSLSSTAYVFPLPGRDDSTRNDRFGQGEDLDATKHLRRLSTHGRLCRVPTVRF